MFQGKISPDPNITWLCPWNRGYVEFNQSVVLLCGELIFFHVNRKKEPSDKNWVAVVKQLKFFFSIVSKSIFQVTSLCNCMLIVSLIQLCSININCPGCTAFNFNLLFYSRSFSVPTVDTTRTTWLLEQMVKIKHPVVLVGESGTSKTATTQNFLSSLNEDLNVRMRHFALFIKLHFHFVTLC